MTLQNGLAGLPLLTITDDHGAAAEGGRFGGPQIRASAFSHRGRNIFEVELGLSEVLEVVAAAKVLR